MAGRLARASRWSAAIVGAAAAAWIAGLLWFAADIPPAARPDGDAIVPQTDAIVVLTGGSSRLRVGLALLAAGAARKLFVSGVYRGVDVAELLRVARQEPRAIECCITLGYAADNTAGNAVETRGWMQAEGFTSVRLVTANYHMRRSLLEFRRAMPELTIIAHPVEPDSFTREDWWRRRTTFLLIVGEYNKYLAAALRPSVTALFPWIDMP